MERRQAFKFELRENGEQRRQMRRCAGSVRFVYNHALALQEEMYELTGKAHTRFQLDRLLTLWKQEKPWVAETRAHALQQAYRNFFKKRADVSEVQEERSAHFVSRIRRAVHHAGPIEQPHSIAEDWLGALSQQP